MSGLVGCINKPEFDRFATTKSGGQLMLCAGLFADSLPEIVHVYKAGPESMYYYYPVLVLLILILILSFTGIMLSLVLGLNTYPAVKKTSPAVKTDPEATGGDGEGQAVPGKCPLHLKIMNDTLTVITMLIFILVAIKSALRDGVTPDIEKSLLADGTSTSLQKSSLLSNSTI